LATVPLLAMAMLVLGSLLVFTFALVPMVLSSPLAVWLICVAAFTMVIGGQIFGVLWYTTRHLHVDHMAEEAGD
jgi:hypothetical protein